MKNGYSICFNEWALDKDIKNELGLLLIISSLCAEKGYCYASNKYLAEIFDTNEITISRKIKLLESKNYILIEYEKRGCQVISRKLRLTKMLIDDYQNCKSTINKNVKENIISNNNNNNLNEFKLYNNFDQNLQCEHIIKSSNERCMRKSSFNINGKNYCNQHARNLIPDLEIRTTKNKNYFNNKEVNDLFNEFLELRKKLKAVNSERAIKLLIDKLNLYDDEIKIKMINNSIENSWKSVYPLKKEKNKKIITENELKEIERKYADK